MALKTNFTDDILAESMNGKRQYNVTDNSNGTKSLEDVTDYQSVGSTFSAKDMNETNAAVNQACDDIRELTEKTDNRVGSYRITYIDWDDSTERLIFTVDGTPIYVATARS